MSFFDLVISTSVNAATETIFTFQRKKEKHQSSKAVVMAPPFNSKCYSVCVMGLIWMYSLKCGNGNSFEDFEGRHANSPSWSTTDGSPFHVVTGAHKFVPGAPLVDTTMGTSSGKYCIASYESPNISWLASQCFLPSNPKCTIRFSGFFNTKPDEEINVCVMKQCDMCQPVRYDGWCLYQQNLGPTEKWTTFEIPIGFSPTPFDISFGVALAHNGSFVALDDIEVLDCQTEIVEQEVEECSAEEVFRCNYTNTCIARDELCDLYPNCYCGEDEAYFCEEIPPEGRVDLIDCNLDDGSCLWYNAYEEVTEDDANRGSVIKQGDQQETHLPRWDIKNHTRNETAYNNDGTINADTFLLAQVPPYPKTAILRSVSLKPRYTGGGLCQIRFNYHITSSSAKLELILLELGKGTEDRTGPRTKLLWETLVDPLRNEKKEEDVENEMDGKAINGTTVSAESSMKPSQWKRVVVDLNGVPINVSYVLQFKVSGIHSSSTGEAMIHSITLGRECFTPDISLTTCGSFGPKGPEQTMCDKYHEGHMAIKVIETGNEKGIQTWTVPETQEYRIQAYGASGGLGLRSTSLVKRSRGSKVIATFKLKARDVLYFLVGQRGSEACHKDTWSSMPPFCLKNATYVDGGGGGGGGATVVYQKDGDNKIKILLIAGGGGGLPFFHYFDNTPIDVYGDGDLDRKTALQKSTVSILSSDNPDSLLMDQSEAEAFLQGNLEGKLGCSHTTSPPIYWGGAGGFGGGGGACSDGGNGGGPNVKTIEEVLSPVVGHPGLSFIHPDALSSSIEHDSHGSDGIAEVESLWFCPCAYKCMWQGPKFKQPTCLCPKGSVLQRDGYSCEDLITHSIDTKEDSDIALDQTTIIIFIVFFIVFICFSIVFVCIFMKRSNMRNRLPIRPKRTIQILCPCFNFGGRPLTFNSHVLPQITNPPAVMHENAIYNRVSTKGTEKCLNEIPRKHLKLVGELGQGAFGEVYYGLLAHMPMVEGDLPVAVKTLPSLCTEQTEMDFVLEALIVSKFNHPNIVKFIGTCFDDQHPHYLILELLEGGDLKSFLHQTRPRRDTPSSITMIDLLRLSLDISRGCQHLEEKHFIHRDIAARNCLLTTKGPNRIAKIADFGMARNIYRSDYYKKAGRAMLPVKWTPPEAFLDGIFTSKTDVWSYGILLWEVFSLGHMPYPGYSNEEVMNLVTKGGRLDPPVGCPSNVFDIMVSCWAGIPESRPNFTLIISILERTIQDDETSSCGLPVYYAPPVIHSKRTYSKGTSIFPLNGSKGACGQLSEQSSSSSKDSKVHLDYEKEQGYLEPLIARKSNSSPSKHVFLPT